MILTINEKDYVVATNLKVAYDIEHNKNNKKVLDIMTDENLTLEDMLKLIYVGFKVNNPDIKFSDFQEMILGSDNFGYVEVQMEFQVFCNLILSKKETEAEIRKKLNDALNKKQAEINKELKN